MPGHQPFRNLTSLTRFMLLAVLLPVLAGCMDVPAPPTPRPVGTATSGGDLNTVKSWLAARVWEFKGQTAAVSSAANTYYQLCAAAGFDYAALQRDHATEVQQRIAALQSAWQAALASYRQIRGLVGGLDALARWDLILYTGTSAARGGNIIIPIEVALPDGRTLSRPGNLFALTHDTFWAADPVYSDAGLPDCAVAKGAAAALDYNAAALVVSTTGLNPITSSGFTAPLAMLPEVSDLLVAWQNERRTHRDADQLSEAAAILNCLQLIYGGVSASVRGTDPAQDRLISSGLAGLNTFVSDLAQQQTDGSLGDTQAALAVAEAQTRADLLAGQLTQFAAELNLTLEGES